MAVVDEDYSDGDEAVDVDDVDDVDDDVYDDVVRRRRKIDLLFCTIFSLNWTPSTRYTHTWKFN